MLEKIGIPLKEEQFNDMKSVIGKALNDTSLEAGRDVARKEAWMHRGESAKRIADYLIEKQKEINSNEATK